MLTKLILFTSQKKITSKDNFSYSDNDEIEAFQEAEETQKVGQNEDEDEAEADREIREEENEIKEEDDEIGEVEDERNYISSDDDVVKGKLIRLRKQYKKQ